MNEQLTYDPTYDVVDPKDFRRLIEVDRYGRRSAAFDAIISATHEHFWDPLDPAYLDFSTPFDLENEYLLPPHRIQEMRGAIMDRLTEKQRIGLCNRVMHWQLSGILHGEQAALSLSAGLSLGMVRSAQILPNLWWKASSVMTSCTSRLSSGSLACACRLAKAPMARPSSSICTPTSFFQIRSVVTSSLIKSPRTSPQGSGLPQRAPRYSGRRR